MDWPKFVAVFAIFLAALAVVVNFLIIPVLIMGRMQNLKNHVFSEVSEFKHNSDRTWAEMLAARQWFNQHRYSRNYRNTPPILLASYPLSEYGPIKFGPGTVPHSYSDETTTPPNPFRGLRFDFSRSHPTTNWHRYQHGLPQSISNGQINNNGQPNDYENNGPYGQAVDNGNSGQYGQVPLTRKGCAPGPRGRPGLNGKDGIPGNPGGDGLPGLDPIDVYYKKQEEECQICPPGRKGRTGSQGRLGPQGAKGSKGRKGEDAPNGWDGQVGEFGPAGEKGPSGTPGGPGEPGDDSFGGTGPPGPRGGKGVIGRAGLQGPPGRKNWISGRQGTSGLAGKPGLDGIPASDGPTGEGGQPGLPGAGAHYCPCPKELGIIKKNERGSSQRSLYFFGTDGIQEVLEESEQIPFTPTQRNSRRSLDRAPTETDSTTEHRSSPRVTQEHQTQPRRLSTSSESAEYTADNKRNTQSTAQSSEEVLQVRESVLTAGVPQEFHRSFHAPPRRVMVPIHRVLNRASTVKRVPPSHNENYREYSGVLREYSESTQSTSRRALRRRRSPTETQTVYNELPPNVIAARIYNTPLPRRVPVFDWEWNPEVFQTTPVPKIAVPPNPHLVPAHRYPFSAKRIQMRPAKALRPTPEPQPKRPTGRLGTVMRVPLPQRPISLPPGVVRVGGSYLPRYFGLPATRYSPSGNPLPTLPKRVGSNFLINLGVVDHPQDRVGVFVG